MSAINEVTKDDLLQLALVATAAADGKAIQHRRKETTTPWHNKAYTGHWDPDEFEYRVQPEPRECWVNVYLDDGSIDVAHKTEAAARKSVDARTIVRTAIHMREVMDNE